MDGGNVKKIAHDFSNEIDKFNRQIELFDKKLDEVYTAWRGADAEKFVGQMKERDIAELKEISSMLSNYSNYLKDIPDVYSALDEVYSGKAIDF